MDGEEKILIVSFLGHIQVSSRKSHGKVGEKTVSKEQNYLIGCERIPFTTYLHPAGLQLKLQLSGAPKGRGGAHDEGLPHLIK